MNLFVKADLILAIEEFRAQAAAIARDQGDHLTAEKISLLKFEKSALLLDSIVRAKVFRSNRRFHQYLF